MAASASQITKIQLTLYQNNKIVDWSKLKAFADEKMNVAEMMVSLSDRSYCGKRRKCWLPAFSPFPTF